jgi:hypothetical protein
MNVKITGLLGRSTPEPMEKQAEGEDDKEKIGKRKEKKESKEGMHVTKNSGDDSVGDTMK